MKARTAGIGLAAALSLVLPAAAMGEEEAASVVPPENSAATQYTEAIPTAGGDKEANNGGRKPSPAKVLGAKNAKRLESHGKEGREVAEIVAETAPTPTASTPPSTSPSQSSQGSSDKDGGAKENGDGHQDAAGGTGSGGSGPPPGSQARTLEPTPTTTELPSGSSGLGEIVAEATGSSSSGRLGALLPLAILAAIAWAFAYFWRQRRPVE